MEEIIESINLVINAPFFWTLIGIIFSSGIFIGWWYDQRLAGFRKSLTLILPYGLLMLLATLSRLYETAQGKQLTATAFNGVVTWVLFTIFYILGLFIGHMADRKGKERAQELHALV